MAFMLALVLPSIVSATATCYFRNGNVAPSSFMPCNVNATGAVGSHSSCCYPTNNDVCLASGLCLYPGLIHPTSGYALLFADGCTDKNLADLSCQTFCPSTAASVQSILNCGGGTFCCIDFGADTNATACCGGHTFQLPNGLGMPINQTTATIVSTVTATATGNGMSGSTENHTAVAAVGSVLSTLLAVSLCAIAFLIWKLRRLQSGSGGASVAPPSGTTAQVNSGKGPVEAVGPRPYELPERRG